MFGRSRPFVVVLLLVTAVALAAQQDRVSERDAPERASGAAPGARLQITDVGTAFVVMPLGSPLELSGLTWAGGDLFYTVSDNDPSIHPFDIEIDEVDGHIRAITRRPPLALYDQDGRPSRGEDLEGVAFDPDGPTITVVDEGGLWNPRRSIMVYSASDGRQVDAIDMRGSYFADGWTRGGLGLESLARRGATVWTANEEGLRGDGPRSTPERGTVVRLTRFDEGRLTGQWAYQTDPTDGALAYSTVHVGGVVELSVLDDGRLLVLERATMGRRGPDDLGGFINRIYLVDTRSGTNVLGTPRLAALRLGADFRPVEKTLLWSRPFPLLDGPTNFEGMALGPVLADGSRSLILVSDNDRVPSALWPLRLSPASPGLPVE